MIYVMPYRLKRKTIMANRPVYIVQVYQRDTFPDHVETQQFPYKGDAFAYALNKQVDYAVDVFEASLICSNFRVPHKD